MKNTPAEVVASTEYSIRTLDGYSIPEAERTVEILEAQLRSQRQRLVYLRNSRAELVRFLREAQC